MAAYRNRSYNQINKRVESACGFYPFILASYRRTRWNHAPAIRPPTGRETRTFSDNAWNILVFPIKHLMHRGNCLRGPQDIRGFLFPLSNCGISYIVCPQPFTPLSGNSPRKLMKTEKSKRCCFAA